MARPLWKGAISFGLVHVPVELYSAVDKKKVQFHILAKDGSCRLRQKLYCPETGKEYDFKDTARGIEIAPDQYALVQADELADLKPEGGRTIQILDFIDIAEIDPIFFDNTYYVAPGENGEKPYRLLVEAMKQSKRAGIATFVMRSAEYLCTLRAFHDEILALETMYFADDIRAHEDIVPQSPQKVDKRELALALQLVDALTGTFEPEKYHNEHKERVEELIRDKVEGKDIVAPGPAPGERGQVLDLMEALKKSLRDEPKDKRKSGARAKANQETPKAKQTSKPREPREQKRANSRR